MSVILGTKSDDLLVGGDEDDLLLGGKGDDILDGGDGDDLLLGGKGDDLLDGGDGDDLLLGGKGDDTILGGTGDDILIGNSGDDTLDAGDGNDLLYAGTGDDSALFQADINWDNSNVYDGGSGTDTLELTLTHGEALAAQQELDAYQALLATDSSAVFEFTTFDFKVVNWEILNLNLVNSAAITGDDENATDEDTTVSGNVLLNDYDSDHLDQIWVASHDAQSAAGALIGVAADGSYSYEPGQIFQYLAEGETATDTFNYVIRDLAGATSVGTVTITMTGTNDAPLANTDAGSSYETAPLVLDVLANDTDVDSSDTHTLEAVSVIGGGGNVSIIDNQLRWDPGTYYDFLNAGESETVVIEYSMSDNHGASATGSATISVIGASELYIKTADNELLKINERALYNEDGTAVDISSFTQGDAVLMGYTIPDSPDMTLGDLLDYTTLLGNSADMTALPMFPVAGSDASMLDMASMFSSMMNVFSAGQSDNVEGLSMSTGMMDAMAGMMQQFMGGMFNMPVDLFSQMMQDMLDLLNSDEIIDPLELASNMQQMMETSMSSLPLESFSAMMTTMMETLPAEMEASSNPMDTMAEAMGNMMLSFMQEVTGSDAATAIEDFGLSMGEMFYQFMVTLTGGSDDPAAAMGDMMGQMFNAMMSSMTGAASVAMDGVSSTISSMMSQFIGGFTGSFELGMQGMQTLTDSMNTQLSLFSSMFEVANDVALSMVEQSPQYIDLALLLSREIGATADRLASLPEDSFDAQQLSSEITAMQDTLSGMTTLFAEQADVVQSMPDFQAMMQQMQLNSEKLDALAEATFSSLVQSLPSNLYVELADGSIVSLSETALFDANSLSVDITDFLNGSQLLIGYTVADADMLSVDDLLQLTTLTQPELFNLSELPLFSVSGNDLSMDDMNVMIAQLMETFLGGAEGEMTAEMQDAFMGMMSQFVGVLDEVPIEDFMSMMQQMMELMTSNSGVDLMMAMAQSMTQMMQDTMASMPIEAFGEMMGLMMDTFSEEVFASDDPFVNMANSMGSMMLSFMDGITGSDSAAPAQDFALSMGEMMQQFMVGLSGGSEDPAAALGDMMGSMMGAMMTGMSGVAYGDSVSPINDFTVAMNDMMAQFMSSMSGSAQQLLDPVTELMNTLLLGMESNMALMQAMFETANDTVAEAIEMSPVYMQAMLQLSDEIGGIADNIGLMADDIVETQVILSSNYLDSQAQVMALIDAMLTNETDMQTVFGSENFNALIQNLQQTGQTLTGLVDMGTMLPSNLYVQDENGQLSMVSETELMDDNGLSVDVSAFLNGDMLLMAYTVPTSAQMSLGDLFDMTTILQSGVELSELPLIPTDSGFVSINEMSTMMNSMMSLFMGGQMVAADDSALDMDAMQTMIGSMMDPAMMENMLEPFMAMMESFTAGMDISELMPMMEDMGAAFISPDMMTGMADMANTMMTLMNDAMSAMPVEEFGSMMGVMIETFSNEIISSDDPFVDMANTMGMMMRAFMDGMTGNASLAPAQEFALTMGEMVNQFMVGLTGGNEDPAAALGDMMGTMMGAMMAGMTGNSDAPMQSFTTAMADMMEQFMTTAAEGIVSFIDPMVDIMSSMMSVMDDNMDIMASMFESANDTAALLIEQSPLYIETILSLSDDIGGMADQIGAMADTIVETQEIQSINFLATQDNALELIELLMGQPDSIRQLMDFDTIMNNLTGAVSMMQDASQAMPTDMISSTLYMVDAQGIMTQVSEADLLVAQGNAVDISDFMDGNQLLVGYTLPDNGNMTLGDLMSATTIIQDQFSLTQLPMFSLDGSSGDSSIMDMSIMLNQMLSMFLGAQNIDGSTLLIDTTDMSTLMDGLLDPSLLESMTQSGTFDPALMQSMSEPFMAMMTSFMGSAEDMPIDMFTDMMTQMMDTFISSGMVDAMANMANGMMSMMNDTMSAMPVEEFGSMMGLMMDTFSEEILLADDPFAAMANTMGAMMLAFMDGMTGNQSEAPAQEFALTMGEMINQFMVGLTGGNEDPAAAMGDMMGSMMGAMMAGMTGNSETPLLSFTTAMTDMMGGFMTSISQNIVTISEPVASMMTTMMNVMDGNMDVISSMFDTANDTAGLLIEQSPLYIETMLRLSDDIGLMADRIGDMADNIVETQVIQSANFMATQENALELIKLLLANETLLTDSLGMGQDVFDTMLTQLDSAQSIMTQQATTVEIFPSNLYVQDATGQLSQISETDLLDASGSFVSIEQFLNGEQLLVAYTIPNSQTMTLGEIQNLTTLIDTEALSFQQLPVIPTENGMISVNEMSAMMNTMMGMFMGSQLTTMEDVPFDMAAMEAMMDPFMEMMSSFMGGMDMAAMMPMMEAMMSSMLDVMQDTDVMDTMASMASTMMEMMNTTMAALPIDEFGSMAGLMMDTFTTEILSEGNPFENMANTMGSMMLAFMDGMTGNQSEAPAQEFALTMGEMINQFMVGLTGGNEDPAAVLGDMMGSMMTGVMAGMTGDAEAPLQSFADTMVEMMDSFVHDMATSMATVMEPMTRLMTTFVNGIDGNMAFIESMFNTANDTALSLIEQSPEYMTAILALSDDIGEMADRINEMADRIVDTQEIQSVNFLAVQDSALVLIDMLLANSDRYINALGATDFNAMMSNLTAVQTTIDELVGIESFSMDEVFASELYLQDVNGLLTRVSETDLLNPDGSVDVTALMSGEQLLVGYTIPNVQNMSLSELMNATTLIESGGLSVDVLPMFALPGGDMSLMDMSGMMQSMMGMFMGSGITPTGEMDASLITPFMSMMEGFAGGIDGMPVEEFTLVMNEMMDTMMNSGMADSMMEMSASMMNLMTSSLGSMPINSFTNMMGSMVSAFSNMFADGETPMEAMAHTMGAMMLSFMDGMTGNDSEVPAQEFARTMGEMINQFMVGVSGVEEEPAAAIGDMMGSMMGSFMIAMTGDSETPLESFIGAMTTMMGATLTSFSEAAAIVLEPAAQMMNTFLTGIDANMEFIASMFDTLNDTAQAMIELSPEYMETILRLSDDIGTMADRIDEMADSIVETTVLQSTNFLATQENALELIGLLNANSDQFESVLGAGFATMMDSLSSVDETLGSITTTVDNATATILPSGLLLQEMTSGEWFDLNEFDITEASLPSVEISTILDQYGMLVGYDLPTIDGMTIAQLMDMMTLIETDSFTLDMLPMFGQDNTIVDINTVMQMMQDTQTLELLTAPVDQFESMFATYQAQLSQYASPFDAMAATMGMMMVSFMEGITDSEGEQTPLAFAELIGEMMREFTIGVTDSPDGPVEEPVAAMGEMMGSMVGSFMMALTDNVDTPMTQFSNVMSDTMHSFTQDMTQSLLTISEPLQDLMNTVINGLNNNMGLIAQMFDSANGTIQSLIEQAPVYLDTMLRLSDDIGLMADRINDMADKVVDVEEIMSDNFLATQDNALELISMITAESHFLQTAMGDELFNTMMSNFTALAGAMQSVTTSAADSMDVGSSLYQQNAAGELVAVDLSQLALLDGSTDVTEYLGGNSLLLGYSIPGGSDVNLSQFIDSAMLLNTQQLNLPTSLLSAENIDTSTLNMAEMMSSMMQYFMGLSMGLDMQQSVSTPFMQMMESFANGMGLELDEFESLMSEMMDTMMANDMMASMTELADSMLSTISLKIGDSPIETFSEMMEVMISTFMADGSPLATVADMMGSMMVAFMDQLTPGENNTLDEMANYMGQVMNAFFVGFTEDTTTPAVTMAAVMTEMMNNFMDAVTGEGEDFALVLNTMMDSFVTDMQDSFDAVAEPMSDSIDAFLGGMNANMDVITGMMLSANDTLEAVLDLNPQFMDAMLALSDDVLDMVGRIDEMVGKMADTQLLLSDDLVVTRDNIQTLLVTLGAEGASADFDADLFTLLQANMETASVMMEQAINLIDLENISNTLLATSDDDLFSFAAGDGGFSITGFEAGEGSADVIDLTDFDFALFSELESVISPVEDNVLIDLGAGDQVALIGVNVNDLHPDDFLI